MSETRRLNIMINGVGNKTNSVNYRISIPSSWAKQMGITKNDREVEVVFRKNNTIVIKKVKKTNRKDTENVDK